MGVTYLYLPSTPSGELMNSVPERDAPTTPERTERTGTDTNVTPTRTSQRVKRFRNEFHTSQLGAAPKKIVVDPLGLLADVAFLKECLMYGKFKVVCDNCKSGPRQGKRCKMLLLMKKRDHAVPSHCG